MFNAREVPGWGLRKSKTANKGKSKKSKSQGSPKTRKKLKSLRSKVAPALLKSPHRGIEPGTLGAESGAPSIRATEAVDYL